MAFKRSPSGQANRAIFLQADLTCYVEGCPGNSHGVDIAFWKSIFDALAPDRIVRLIPRGGKPVLEALARDIAAKNISNTIVAMDRDYSFFRQNAYIIDVRILYTFGYSWENDVFSMGQIPKIARQLARIASLPQVHQDDLDGDIWELDALIGKYVFADFVAILKGGSVFDRDRPGRYTRVTATGRPRFAKDRFKQDVAKARCELKGRVIRPCNGYPQEQSRYLWGKAFEHYVRLGLNRTVGSISGRTFSPEHVRDVAIVCFANCLATGQNSLVLDYYRHVVASLP